jgi:hypothetical protein
MEKIDILIVVIWGQFEPMSLHPQPIPPVPEETSRVALAAFPQGNIYLQIRDTLGGIYEDSDFADLFSVKGQPAQSPWRLALICVMQYMENLSDRQAADAVRGRIDWKYALSLSLEDSGFDFSALSEEDYGVELIGPVRSDPSWQAKHHPKFASSNFQIDYLS